MTNLQSRIWTQHTTNMLSHYFRFQVPGANQRSPLHILISNVAFAFQYVAGRFTALASIATAYHPFRYRKNRNKS